MVARLVRIVASVILSLALTSSAVAGVLRNCEREYGAEAHFHSDDAASTSKSNQNSSIPEQPARIHCPEATIASVLFGPLSSSFRFEPPVDAILLLSVAGARHLHPHFLSIERLIVLHRSPYLMLARLRI